MLWPDENIECPWVDERRSAPEAPIRMPNPAVMPDLKGPLCYKCATERYELSVKNFQGYSKTIVQALNNCIAGSMNHDVCKADEKRLRQLPGTNFRLIDTLRRCIVEDVATHAYVALSYVWGHTLQLQLTGATHHQLLVDGALDVDGMRPSQTILEAIALCRAIGQRYLWVDSLCIKQDNARDKRIQITRMRKIYREAIFTIIAACGSDADASLEIRDASDDGSSHAKDIYSNSIWAERGWTYQEDVLSHRQIVFSPKGLYFKCQDQLSRIFRDSVVDISRIHSGKISFLRALTLPDCQLEAYCQAVGEYTSRKLTYQSDLLNAFQGIIQSFGSRLDGHPNFFHYGLPTSSFDQMFCWDTDSHYPHRRRSDWPSWSWLGWDQMVYWPTEALGYDKRQRTAQMLWYQHHEKIQRIGRFQHQYLGRIHCGFIADRQSEEGEFVWGLPVAATGFMQWHRLDFRGLVASLRVKAILGCLRKTENGLSSRYLVMDALDNNVIFGTISLDRSWRDARPELLEFLLSDGKMDASGKLVGTQLMCLDLQRPQLRPLIDCTRVNTMRCRVEETDWKAAGAVLVYIIMS